MELNHRSIVAEILAGLLSGLILGALIGFTYVINTKPKVDLPEEYQLITTKDTLQGYYDKRTETLYISFNNKRNK